VKLYKYTQQKYCENCYRKLKHRNKGGGFYAYICCGYYYWLDTDYRFDPIG
jgi:hypothetical protein